MLEKIVIANRGEIALRILRACKELGIKTVAVYSTIDRDLKHVLLADETVCIGPPPAIHSYLNIPAIISAAEITGSSGIHPGYGFLSENADFAEQVERSGFVFIGPHSETIRLMGNKISAIAIMKESGIKSVPGWNYELNKNINNEIYNFSHQNLHIDYPIIIKSAHGGGGRGMCVVKKESDLQDAIRMMRSEAKNTFNNDTIYVEQYLKNPRHIEIQVLSDGKGNTIYLTERDCSVQRRYQKIVEETPALGISSTMRQHIGESCIKVCYKIGYRGVGTFEFLYENNEFFFIEMNTRIQVEHPITEMVTGIDLVREQLKIASGYTLDVTQDAVKSSGHSIECRINAEDSHKFIPSSGCITRFHAPGGLGVRWESHIYAGYSVPPYYDAMIGKLICFGETREIAIARMKNALSELIIDGINTNIELQLKIVTDEMFQKGNEINIRYLEDKLNI
ncbi:acetyl-CoA carboxylase biotin carboxylase subunit [Blochmannia endosymbiont of Camponotus sp. C-003]|uniref:acetyl-CoA carboxylase biotin carboxylase subunit n=1 Tax=unclassified Candidatus Blochmanniella TaxID=711328 RepID=UPI002024C38E|nr:MULTISPECIES: acetyl-CoA carboxylase biotin carboxylase subunit [unclassified Candidatus Blochmannia]URJ23518.1 acetyl-CoA carboxylase biotin carboxylase subunit [Blochmannia endosymbiont of Camponotus sp. C-003]URJ28990.1 acetyl-CoA carboxylase biotin carboxylase subunit [Blochmannia endosymbiont of Camponotus sp. C-046]